MNPNPRRVNIVEQPGDHTATRLDPTTWSFYTGPTETNSRIYIIENGNIGDIAVRNSVLHVTGPRQVYRLDLAWNDNMSAPMRLLEPIGYLVEQPGRSLFYPVNEDGEVIQGIILILPRTPGSPRRWTVIDNLDDHMTYLVANGNIGDYVFNFTNSNPNSINYPEGVVYRIQLNDQGMSMLQTIGPITLELVHSIDSGNQHVSENENVNIISEYEVAPNNNHHDDNVSTTSTLDTFHTSDMVSDSDNDIASVTSMEDNDTVGGRRHRRGPKSRHRTRKRANRKRRVKNRISQTRKSRRK